MSPLGWARRQGQRYLWFFLGRCRKKMQEKAYPTTIHPNPDPKPGLQDPFSTKYLDIGEQKTIPHKVIKMKNCSSYIEGDF